METGTPKLVYGKFGVRGSPVSIYKLVTIMRLKTGVG